MRKKGVLVEGGEWSNEAVAVDTNFNMDLVTLSAFKHKGSEPALQKNFYWKVKR